MAYFVDGRNVHQMKTCRNARKIVKNKIILHDSEKTPQNCFTKSNKPHRKKNIHSEEMK